MMGVRMPGLGRKFVASGLMFSLAVCLSVSMFRSDIGSSPEDMLQAPDHILSREYTFGRILEIQKVDNETFCQDDILFVTLSGEEKLNENNGTISCTKFCRLRIGRLFWRFSDEAQMPPIQVIPIENCTAVPTRTPTYTPTTLPSKSPSKTPSTLPSSMPTQSPSDTPTLLPSKSPTETPTRTTTLAPVTPTRTPTRTPSAKPTQAPNKSPTQFPSQSPSTLAPTAPTFSPTSAPTGTPREPPESPALGAGTIALVSSLSIGSLAAGIFLLYLRRRRIRDDNHLVKLAMSARYQAEHASYDDDNDSMMSNNSDDDGGLDGRGGRNSGRRSHRSKGSRNKARKPLPVQGNEPRMRDNNDRDLQNRSAYSNGNINNSNHEDNEIEDYNYDPTQEITKLGKELLERGFDPYGTTAQNAMHAERAYFNDEMQYYGRHRSTGRQVASTFGQMRKALTKNFSRTDSFRRDEDGRPKKSTVVNPVFSRSRASLSEALMAFYLRHDPDKPVADIDLIIDWVQMDEANVASLKEKLKRKYGEGPDL